MSPSDPPERDRERVLGLCVRLTGDPDAAQDLAQEALYEAWRSELAGDDIARLRTAGAQLFLIDDVYRGLIRAGSGWRGR